MLRLGGDRGGARNENGSDDGEGQRMPGVRLREAVDDSAGGRLREPLGCGLPAVRDVPHRADGREAGEGDEVSGTKLSAWIRDHGEFGRQPPTIIDERLDRIADSFPHYRVSEKQRLLLSAIERRTKPAEATRLVVEQDFPVAWAENANELRYLLRALSDHELISLSEGKEGSTCEITPTGWDYLEEMESRRDSGKQVFVAMSFDATMDAAWSEGIRPALESVDYRAYRVDMDPHNDRIDAKIQAEIKASRFIVADVTGQRQGVYFEAGYALGLGMPVVWCVREDELDDVHFDTRQFNHIVWRDPSELRQLAERVAGAIDAD